MKTKHILIGLGLLAVGITAVVLIKRNTKNEEEPKGQGEVTADAKKNTKITFTRS